MKYTLKSSKLSAVVTYRRGKLAGIEVKKGGFDFDLLANLIPVAEENVDGTMVPVEKKSGDTFFKPALEAWNLFYRNHVGLDYRFTGADGVALAQIGKYLTSLSDAGNDANALALFKLILNRWNELDDFYRKNPDLKFINGQLNKIIYQLKHGKNGVTANGDYADDLRRSFTR